MRSLILDIIPCIYMYYESVAFLYSIISIQFSVCKNNSKKIHAVKCIYICMHFQKQQNKKENLRQVKRSLHLFTMRGKTCRINVMYFISCKICEIEKKITWHYLALFFSSRNKPEAKSCWKTTFCTRIRYKPTALY